MDSPRYGLTDKDLLKELSLLMLYYSLFHTVPVAGQLENDYLLNMVWAGSLIFCFEKM